jgi:hypothetical protein
VSKFVWLIALLALSCGPSENQPSGSQAPISRSTGERDLEREDALEKGRMLSQRAAETLNARLTGALSKGGAEAAVEFCSEVGIPLLDSLADVHQVRFKRAAIRYRNPLNRADSTEARVMAEYERKLAMQEVLKPELIALNGGRWKFFSPIITAPHCLQCHGKELESGVARRIRNTYPEDLAIGFESGQLRGLWSIEL